MSERKKTTESKVVKPPVVSQKMIDDGNEIIKKYTLIGAGVGVIPSPMVNSVGVAVLEIAMIDDLARNYKFGFPTKLALVKAFISLVGSIGPVYLALKSRSAVSSVPLVGQMLSASIYSITGAISVYAVGKIFQQHFESGGLTLSKDNSFLRKIFKEKSKEGKEIIPEMVAQAT